MLYIFVLQLTNPSGITGPKSTVTISIQQTLYAPIFDSNGGVTGIDHTVQFLEVQNGIPDDVLIITSDATLTDLDDVGGDCELDLPISCTVNLTNPLNGIDEFLRMTQRPQSLITESEDHVITMTSRSGTAQPRDFILAIHSISYNNLAEEPNETPRLINISCFDGVLNSNPNSVVTIDIQVTNDSPFIDLNGVNVSGKDLVFAYTEGEVESVLASQLEIIDPDSPTLVSAEVRIIEVFDMNNETLTFRSRPPTGITCSPSSCNGTSIVLSGSATLNDYQTFLRTLAYTNYKVPQDLPDLRDREVQVEISDGSASVSCIINIDFLATVPRAIIDLDAPHVNYTTTFREGSPNGILICNNNTIRSADSSVDNLLAVEVSLRDRELEAEERIFIARADQIKLNVSVETNFALKTISFKGNTVDTYIQAIKSIQYITEADEPKDVVRYVDVLSFPDGGVPSTLATAIINIQLINDNAPEFANVLYNVSVYEDASVTSSVFNFSAMDIDSGRDSQFAFQIVDGNEDGKFEINDVTGLLSLAQTLDFETQQVYNITVQVEDFGAIVGPLSANQTLPIYVIDVNDNFPMFEEYFYNVSFPENMEGIILTFNITDEDSGINKQIDTLQVINSSSALFGDASILSLNTSGLNFEDEQVHVVTVIAYDAGLPSLSGTTVVQINVIDIDDFPPVFNQSTYNFTIDEDNTIGDVVGQVFAADSDSQQNITYMSFDSRFSIDMVTGVITIQVVACLPSTPFFSFDITAVDVTGNRADPITVNVVVNDINNNPTVLDFSAANDSTFNAISATSFVEESLPVLLNIDLAITDADQIPLEISMISARIIDPLDNEEYLLVHYSSVTVSGNGTHTVVITPRLSNFNTITNIIQSLYYGNDATEPTPCIGACGSPYDRVIEVNITDAIGQTTAAQAYIQFSYTNDAPLLNLNSVMDGTGNQIQYIEDRPPIPLTNQPQIIDPDSNSFTSLNISLTSLDPGEFLIIDVDPPLSQTGNQTSYILVEGIASRLTYLNALRSVHYGSTNNNPTELDRNVTFTISDGVSISPPAVAVVQYNIVGDQPVLDLDGDNSFSQNYYTSFTEEGASVAVANMASIFDGDDDDIQLLQIILNGGYPNEDLLIINSSVFPGVTFEFPNITITQVASTDRYTDLVNAVWYRNTEDEILDTRPRDITFLLQDTGGNFSTVVSTMISLIPVDDHAPFFANDDVTVSTPEDSPAGTPVVHLTITDEDLGETPDHNCMISNVEPPSLMTAFSVNISLSSTVRAGMNFSVVLVLEEPIDREVYEFATISIVCSISNVDTNATIKVTVVDVNDNCPVWSNPSANYTVTENQPPYTPLDPSSITASDTDVSSVLSYSISHDPTGIVGINSSTGELFTLIVFDREYYPYTYYEIIVIVSDGICNISFPLTLCLIDLNDNLPFFDPSNYSIELIENLIPLYPVVNVTVVDDDQTPVYDLEIIDGPFSSNFVINSRGEIRLVTPLDHEANNSFTLVISVTDPTLGPNVSYASINVEVLNRNDEKPVIVPIPSPTVTIVYGDNNTVAVIIIRVEESRNIFDIVYTVMATDADPNAQLVYSFIYTTASFPFAINDSTGHIGIVDTLDAETEQIFYTILRVRDVNGDPAYTNAHTTDANITFIVQDVNDLPPRFSQDLYYTAILENINVGAIIDLSIAANDSDYGLDSYYNSNGNAEVEYFISEVGVPFSINSTSGLLTLLYSLDRESVEYYNFTVMARDMPVNDSSLTATASVVIRVVNVNDNSPVADPENYNASVSENIENVPLETSVPYNLRNGKIKLIINMN